MINYCNSKGVYCLSATDLGFCSATACTKKPDYEEVLSYGVAKIIDSDGREYVPIVRCKDCKHWDKVDTIDGVNYGTCERKCTAIRTDAFPNENWFCADGEKG